MNFDDHHAVRWAKRREAYDTAWTKWHWTTDANTTLCGRQIIIIRDDCPMPEASDEIGVVDCKICLKMWLDGKDAQ